MTRRILPLLLALVASVGLLASPVGPTAPEVVRGATPDLTVVSAARYDVQPQDRRVRVTVDLTLRNRLKDTTTRRFFFDYAVLDVLPGASGFRVTGAGGASVRVNRDTDDHTRLRIDFGRNLFSGRSAEYRLTFFLEDPGGAPTRDLRIGDSLISFPVWAFATEETPGSSVTVVVPEGYEMAVEAGEIPEPDALDDGRIVYRTGALDDPLSFFAYLVGTRPGAYDETVVRTEVAGSPVSVTVRSWSDDAPWGERVGALLVDALPVLREEIGLEWPASAMPLTVQEAVSRSTGGYAGRFDPSAGLVDIAYYAGDFVVLHEAAHAWFNGRLLADRWANEAFASFYATRASGALDRGTPPEPLTDELRKARIPLNDWGPVGRTAEDAESYAYAAALELAQAIARRAGVAGLREVWADASSGIGAYQPLAGEPETVDGPPDWRGLLDLLEANTDATYDDLWREWVARPTDLVLLDERAAARTTYDAVLTEARDWRLPQPIRDALRAWRFEDAETLLEDARAVLAARAEVAAAAAASDLIVPDDLRGAFEDDDGFEDAMAQAGAELDLIGQYTATEALRPAEVTPLLALGLYGTTPEADLVAARDAFAGGELEDASRSLAAAAAVWSGAESVGQTRAISIALLVLAAVLGLAILVAAIRRRRRRRSRMHATRLRS